MAQSVEIAVPQGLDVEEARSYAEEALRQYLATREFSRALEVQADLVQPGTAAQLVRVDHLWRHLVDKYGAYTSREIAELRGADPGNRSVATNLAKREKLLSFTRGRNKLYPRFQFKRADVHPSWKRVVTPLLGAGWDPQDILQWMVAPHEGLDGAEPADVFQHGDLEQLLREVEDEAKGIVW